jgi:phosphotransferase system IIB component
VVILLQFVVFRQGQNAERRFHSPVFFDDPHSHPLEQRPVFLKRRIKYFGPFCMRRLRLHVQDVAPVVYNIHKFGNHGHVPVFVEGQIRQIVAVFAGKRPAARHKKRVQRVVVAYESP